MVINEMKICSLCKSDLHISNFFKIKGRGDGYSYSCRSCRKELNSQYWKENKDKINEYNKKWRDKNLERVNARRMKNYYANREHKLSKMKEYYANLKSSIFNAYNNECSCCKENKREFLCIDHIHGGGNKDRKSSNPKAVYIRIKKEGFPKDKYRLLCHNCNMSIGFFGYCPHQPNIKYQNLTGRPKKAY